MADPIVLRWEQEGMGALLRVLERLDNKLEDIGKETDDTDKKTKQFTRTTKGLGTEARKTGKAMRAFGDAFSGINSGAGRATRTGGRLLQVFGNISALGAGGVAFAGVTAGAFALSGAVATGAKELATLAANGREAAEELKPFSDAGFFAALDESQLSRFDRIGASFDAISTATKGAGLALANEFAPEIEDATTLVVAMTLAVSDNVETIGNYVRRVGQAATRTGEWVQSLGGLARLGLIAVTGGLSEAVVGVGEFADGLDDTGGAAGDYIDRARALISVQQGVNKSFTEGVDIFGVWDAQAAAAAAQFDAFSDTLPDIAVETEKINRAAQAQIETLQDTAAQYSKNEQLQQETALAILAIEERVSRDTNALREQARKEDAAAWRADNEARIAEIEASANRQRAFYEMMRQSAIQGTSQSLGAISDLARLTADTLAEEGARGALAMFRVNQAAALANIGVLTAEAIMRGMTSPTPILSATGAGLVGAAQAAAVVAQAPPKVEAHSGIGPLMGGGQARTGGTTADPTERDVRITTSEAVIGPEAMSALAGALNAQRMPAGGGSVARAFIGRETLDRGMDDNLSSGTSRYSRRHKKKSRTYRRGVGRG